MRSEIKVAPGSTSCCTVDRPVHGIRLQGYFLTDTDHGTRHVPWCQTVQPERAFVADRADPAARPAARSTCGEAATIGSVAHARPLPGRYPCSAGAGPRRRRRRRLQRRALTSLLRIPAMKRNPAAGGRWRRSAARSAAPAPVLGSQPRLLPRGLLVRGPDARPPGSARWAGSRLGWLTLFCNFFYPS